MLFLSKHAIDLWDPHNGQRENQPHTAVAGIPVFVISQVKGEIKTKLAQSNTLGFGDFPFLCHCWFFSHLPDLKLAI